MRIRTLIACLAILAFYRPFTNGQIVAVQSANMTGTSFASDRTYGWQFTVGGSSISVSKLGYFDEGADGLADSHPVGIWDTDGTLLRLVTIPASGGTLIGSFRFTDVTPTILNANQTYYIGGYSASPTDVVFHSSSETFASEITYNTATHTPPENGFARPDIIISASHGVFGPNFEFTPVPEPGEYALAMGLGLGAFFVARRAIAGRTNDKA